MNRIVRSAGLCTLLAMAVVTAGCAGGVFGPDKMTTYASCGGSPNYVGDVTLARWKTLPQEIYIDQSSLPAGVGSAYLDGINQGLAIWTNATHSVVGSLTTTTNSSAAMTLRIVSNGALDSINATGVTDKQVTGDGELKSAKIQIERRNAAAEAAVNTAAGRQSIVAITAFAVAHEIGHALAIEGHSSNPTDLMYRNAGTKYNQSSSTWVTTSDVNTLNQAYCK